jgi:hypothetical protein
MGRARFPRRLFSSEEGLENLDHIVRRDAAAGVFDLDQDEVCLGECAVGGPFPFGTAHILGANRQGARALHGVARVDREVDENLLERPLIDLDQPKIALVNHTELDALADQPAQ